MKLWLDDKRKPPWGYDLWAKTAKEAIAMLEEHGDAIEHCSLDHDLADEHYKDLFDGEPDAEINRSAFIEQTGYAVLEWMHEHGRWTADISVHTLNPKGGEDMMRKLRVSGPSHVKFRRVHPTRP